MAVGGAPNTAPNGPPPSNPQSAPNLVGFDPKQVVPSQPIYFQRNDRLSFTIIVNTSGTTVQINYRFLTPQGEIKEGQLNTGPIFSSAFFNIELYEGWLLSFDAQSNTGFTAGAWTFLQAHVGRPVGGTTVPIAQGLIWESFIRQGVPRGWPGSPAKEIDDGAGEIRSIPGTTPAAGAEINEVVPTNRRWELIALSATLTTSATVANRVPRARLDNGVAAHFISGNSAAQAAGLTVTYIFSPGSQFFNDTNGNVILPLPDLAPLKSGFRVGTSTLGLQAGDQWSAPQYLAIEWGLWDP